MPQSAQSLKDYEDKEFPESDLTREIIACAMEVHSNLGPGLLENIYEQALIHEFDLRKISYENQKEVIISYKDKCVGSHRLDLIVDDKVILELKAVNELHKVFEAQIISYLKATGIKIGLLINFNVNKLKDGIKRFIV